MEDFYLSQADIDAPLLGVVEEPSRIWNFFSSLWSGNNASAITVLQPDAIELIAGDVAASGQINELPERTVRLFSAAPEELPVAAYIPPSPLPAGVHPVSTAILTEDTPAAVNFISPAADVELMELTSISLAPLTQIEEVNRIPWGASSLDVPVDWSHVAPFEVEGADFLDAPMAAVESAPAEEASWIVSQSSREVNQAVDMGLHLQRVPITGTSLATEYSSVQIEMLDLAVSDFAPQVASIAARGAFRIKVGSRGRSRLFAISWIICRGGDPASENRLGKREAGTRCAGRL